MRACPDGVNAREVNGRSRAGSLSKSMPLRRVSISFWLNRKYFLYRSKNVPAPITSVMLSPLMRATVSMVSRSSISTNRHGWLLNWDGAAAAARISSCWCSGLTGSGRNGPLVVRRLNTTSRNSTIHLQASTRPAT